MAAAGSGNVLSRITRDDGLSHSEKVAENNEQFFEQQVMYASIRSAQDLRAQLEEDQRIDLEYLKEIDIKLDEAEKALKRMRDKALKITMPDGTVLNAFRDGDSFRFEDGRTVPPHLIDPDADTTNVPDLDKFQTRRERVDALKTGKQQLIERIDQRNEFRDALPNGPMAEDDLAAANRRLPTLKPVRPPILEQSDITDSNNPTFQTKLQPLTEFTAVAEIPSEPNLTLDDDDLADLNNDAPSSQPFQF